MQNYRVTFGGDNIDYHSNFADCRSYWPKVSAILDILKMHGIDEAWWFFEPYAEVTWLCEDADKATIVMNVVSAFLTNHGIEHKKFTPADGVFGDWHGLTPEERLFGANRYAAIAKTSQCYYENMDTIKAGMGLEKHFARATHVLANQLGMNYEEEGIALLKRGFLAILFWNLGHEKAVTTYEKLFKEKYLGRDEDLH